MSPKKKSKRSDSGRSRKAASLPPPEESSGVSGDPLLPDSRAAWEQGDWHRLAALAEQPLALHDERARLALLAAAGLAQLGDMVGARRQAQLAQSWGCPPRLMAQVLVSGAFNTLGRMASLLDDNSGARSYFDAAISTAYPDRDATLLAQSREIREKAALGLLPEAARLISSGFEQRTTQRSLPTTEASMLRSQIELLNGALGLAQRRGQLTPGRTAESGLERRSVSQLGQDLWVLEQTDRKQGGFFVEFGATDGVLLSNTLLLETEFGWNGICAEPNPEFFAKLKENRACILAPECIAGESGREVDFVLADEYGTMAEYADTDMHVDRRAAYREAGQVIRLSTISLDDFLKKYKAPRQIDYLSIDTEGSEFEILKAFPFENWDIRLLTVEHNFTPIREDIHALLTARGYQRTEMKFDDWYSKPPARSAD